MSKYLKLPSAAIVHVFHLYFLIIVFTLSPLWDKNEKLFIKQLWDKSKVSKTRNHLERSLTSQKNKFFVIKLLRSK